MFLWLNRLLEAFSAPRLLLNFLVKSNDLLYLLLLVSNTLPLP